MTEKIIRRGIKTPDAFEPDLLQNVMVKQLISALPTGVDNLPVVYANDDVGFAAEVMGKYQTDSLLVINGAPDKRPVGIITAASILKYYSEQKQKDHTYHSPARTKRMIVRGRNILQRKR